MKNGTVYLLAALAAAAAVLWYVMRPSLKPAAPPKAAAPPPGSSAAAKQAAINAGIDLASKAGSAFIDWLKAPSSSTPADLGNGTGTADLSLDPYAF